MRAHAFHSAGVLFGRLAQLFLSHQRTKFTGSCGTTSTSSEPGGRSTPLVQCTRLGISQGQMASSTAHGHMARGAARISGGYSPSSPTVGRVGSAWRLSQHSPRQWRWISKLKHRLSTSAPPDSHQTPAEWISRRCQHRAGEARYPYAGTHTCCTSRAACCHTGAALRRGRPCPQRPPCRTPGRAQRTPRSTLPPSTR